MPKGPAVPIMGIWLRKEGDYTNVYIAREDGKFYLAISEYSGPSDNTFSHHISEHGLANQLPLDTLEPANA